MFDKRIKLKTEFNHVPVMPEEAIGFLKVKKDGIYVDATLGGGGHTELIANLLGRRGKIIGIDQDLEAIEMAKKKLARYEDKIIYVYDNFRNLDKILDKLGVEKVDGILFDLGVSTYQLENPKRGFSFFESKENLNAPLDMRMNQAQSFSAQNVINQYPEEKLREILFKLGQEPYAKSISRKIVQKRAINPIIRTRDLLEIIKSATPPKYRFSRKQHYASKVFRAIRMEVNQELVALEEVIPKAVARLKNGGRLIIISFHSLEDRIVKNAFREMARKSLVKLLTKKPVMASQEEINKNPKADSAKLRAVEKL